MTQERAAAESGIDYKRYQRLEQGSVNATLRTLVRVATALRTDFWSVVGDGQDEREARPLVGHGLATVHEGGPREAVAERGSAGAVRERGRRENASERDDAADHRVSISRILPADVSRVVEALTKKRERSRWLRCADPALDAALDAALAAKGALETDEAGSARLRFAWGTSEVVISVTARADGRSTLAVRNRGLATDLQAEERRASWVRTLGELRAHLSA